MLQRKTKKENKKQRKAKQGKMLSSNVFQPNPMNMILLLVGGGNPIINNNISQIPFCCNLPKITFFLSSLFKVSSFSTPTPHIIIYFLLLIFPFFFLSSPLRDLCCFFCSSNFEMLKRKMKGVSIESSSSPFSYDEESRNRFNKHQSLVQDFNELQKETDAMKKKLHKDKQRKLTLLAEVRFLRRRYKFLMRSQSPNTPGIDGDLGRSQAPVSHKESYRMPKPSPVLDLNQISNGEDDIGDYYVSHHLEPPMRMEKKPKRSYSRRVEHQQQHPSDANVLVCREVMNGNRPGKRKISWQDQVALKV